MEKVDGWLLFKTFNVAKKMLISVSIDSRIVWQTVMFLPHSSLMSIMLFKSFSLLASSNTSR